MNEVILVALGNPETAQYLLAAARAIADQVPQTRVEALVVRMPAEATIIPSEEVLTDEQRRRWEAREAARAARLEGIYRAWVAEVGSDGCQCEWIDVVGVPAQEVAARGQGADLVIIDRPSRHPDEAGRETVHAALFDSHRPVLVVPPDPKSILGRHIAIAWRDDGRAIKAVLPALRYFAGAAEISVLIGYRGVAKPQALPPVLAERGIQATVYPLAIGSGPFGEQLLAKAAELGADLLVTGAYVHSPLREMLLGGVTRYVLAHAQIPVLLRH